MFLADFGLTRCELPKSPNIAKLPQLPQLPQAEAGFLLWPLVVTKPVEPLEKKGGDIKWIRISHDI